MTTASASLAIVGSIGRLYRDQEPVLEKPRVEGERQQILEVVRALGFLEVAEHDLEVAAELPENLTAGSAGGRWQLRVGDDRDAREGAVAFRHRLEHRHALGADRQP